jgi:hypothetical protein
MEAEFLVRVRTRVAKLGNGLLSISCTICRRSFETGCCGNSKWNTRLVDIIKVQRSGGVAERTKE